MPPVADRWAAVTPAATVDRTGIRGEGFSPAFAGALGFIVSDESCLRASAIAFMTSSASSACQDDLQPHHPVSERPGPHAALGGVNLVGLGRLPEPSTDSLELGSGGGHGDVRDPLLVLGRRDPRHRADLRVREPSFGEHPIEPRQPAERPRHANLLARGTRIQSDPPCQPVRAALSPLPMPALRGVEFPYAGQHPVRRHVHARSQPRNLISERDMIIGELVHCAQLYQCSGARCDDGLTIELN